jgi:hypothetical protein
MVKIVSLSVKVHTLTLSNHTKLTPETQTLVLMFIHLPFAQKSINQVAHVTSPELITLPFN